MSEVQEDTFCQWQIHEDDKKYFLGAMSKIYKAINVCGFSDRFGLDKNERLVFNDVVEQIALKNLEDKE